MNVSDEVFYAVASATYEVRGNRPLYGSPPALTEAEREIFAESVAKETSPTPPNNTLHPNHSEEEGE